MAISAGRIFSFRSTSRGWEVSVWESVLLLRHLFSLNSGSTPGILHLFSNIYRFPFDSKTPAGYLTAFAFQCILQCHNFLFSLGLVCFGIGTFLFGIALAKILRINLRRINKDAKNKRNRLAAANALSEMIEIQSAEKQLSSCEFFFISS